ncbi:MAG: hypothetical protein V4675_08110 [Verrucomicrobiota bacterium]
MENNIFWILWVATLLLAGWVAVDAVFKPWKLLEWPVLCSVMWLYFYVYMAYDAISNFQSLFTPKALILGQLLPLLSFAALLYGWNVARRTSVQGRRSYATLENRVLICFVGMAMIITGAVGGYLVQAGRDAGGFDYENTSAYVYLAFYVGYPGLALSLWAASLSRGTVRTVLLTLTFVALAIFIYPHVAYLRRGPTFPAILLLLLVPPLATGKAPNRTVYLSGLAILGVVMLAYLPLRKVIYNKGTWAEAFSEFSVTDAVTERGKDIFDNEYINNCHLIEALTDNGKYQYGTGHGSLFLHWIPSSIWKNKPMLGEGIYTHDELFADVGQSAGIQLLGGGAAAGGVADAFVQYGFLTPLFFGLFGWLVSKAYWKGRNEGSLFWIHSYIAFVCATHWLISQGVSAAFVPMLAFLLIPLATLRFIGKIQPMSMGKPNEVPLSHQGNPPITATEPPSPFPSTR